MNGEKDDKNVIDITGKVKKKRAWLKRFSEMSRAEAIVRIICYLFAAFIAVFCVTMLIVYRLKGDPGNRTVSCIAMALLAVAPFVLQPILRFRFSNFTLIFIYIYLLFAGVFGSVLMWYGSYTGYDKAIHGLFGYVGAVAGVFILVKLGEYDKLRAVSVVILVFSVSMALGAMWEIIEFSSDRLLGQHSQGSPVEGYKYALLWDTMWDIIANFIGAIVFCIHYIVHRATKKNLLIGAIVKDFKN